MTLDTSVLEHIVIASNKRITPDDLALLIRAADACQARNILEIGSADGGSSVVLGTMAKQRGGHLTCIEPQPKGRMIGNMKRHGLDGFYTILQAYSPHLGEKEKLLPPEIDLLFIDGSHEIAACLADYRYFAPRVRPGGVIVFHDTGGHCQEDRRQPDYRSPGYVPLVIRAIELIRTTDDLAEIDRSDSPNGGAIAFRKGGAA